MVGGLAANKLMDQIEDAGIEFNKPTRAVAEGAASGAPTRRLASYFRPAGPPKQTPVMVTARMYPQHIKKTGGCA